jgi:hypothetical protein
MTVLTIPQVTQSQPILIKYVKVQTHIFSVIDMSVTFSSFEVFAAFLQVMLQAVRPEAWTPKLYTNTAPCARINR